MGFGRAAMREYRPRCAVWPPGLCGQSLNPTRLDMLVRLLELDRDPAALGVEGDDAAVGAVELCSRLHPADANALPCSERLPGCR
jgi:hypothetical protein